MDMTFTEWVGALGQVLVVVAVSFVVLCAITSFIRFQLMTEFAVESEELGSGEERAFRMAVLNQVAAARRARRPVTVALLRLPPGVASGAVESMIRPVIRAGDAVAVCGPGLVGLLFRCGSEKVEIPLRRIIEQARTAGSLDADRWRVGVAGYPEHGFKTSVLYTRALEMIGEAETRGVLAAGMAPAEEVKDEAAKTSTDAIDPVTGLVSEARMIPLMRRYIAQERRQDLAVSLVYFDIDQPERLLAQHGREVVDQMLKELGAILDQQIRENDIVARFGDSSFVAAVSTAPDAAVQLANRIMQDVRKKAFRAGNGMKVSLSAGVAGYPDVIGTVVQYFVAAEAALRVAKTRGRNQCVKYDQTLPTSENQKPIEPI